jgi:hypothetical protein
MKEGDSAVRMAVEWRGMDEYWQSYGHFGGIWEKKKKDDSDRKKKMCGKVAVWSTTGGGIGLVRCLGCQKKEGIKAVRMVVTSWHESQYRSSLGRQRVSTLAKIVIKKHETKTATQPLPHFEQPPLTRSILLQS